MFMLSDTRYWVTVETERFYRWSHDEGDVPVAMTLESTQIRLTPSISTFAVSLPPPNDVATYVLDCSHASWTGRTVVVRRWNGDVVPDTEAVPKGTPGNFGCEIRMIPGTAFLRDASGNAVVTGRVRIEADDGRGVDVDAKLADSPFAPPMLKRHRFRLHMRDGVLPYWKDPVEDPPVRFPFMFGTFGDDPESTTKATTVSGRPLYYAREGMGLSPFKSGSEVSYSWWSPPQRRRIVEYVRDDRWGMNWVFSSGLGMKDYVPIMWTAASKVVLTTDSTSGECYGLDTQPMAPFIPPREPFDNQGGLGVYGLATENYGRTYSAETARPYIECNTAADDRPLILADLTTEGEDDVIFKFNIFLLNLNVNSYYILRDRLRFEVDTRETGPHEVVERY